MSVPNLKARTSDFVPFRIAARLANKQVSDWLKPITLTIVRAELYGKDRQN